MQADYEQRADLVAGQAHLLREGLRAGDPGRGKRRISPLGTRRPERPDLTERRPARYHGAQRAVMTARGGPDARWPLHDVDRKLGRPGAGIFAVGGIVPDGRAASGEASQPPGGRARAGRCTSRTGPDRPASSLARVV